MKDVLDFWFKELMPKDWFTKSEQLDQLISDRFKEVHTKARACELHFWRDKPEGRLAEIIVLDQFSRNIYRDDPRAFASDPLALALAQESVRSGDDNKIDISRRSFLYMPYMHSESLSVHDEAEKLFSTEGLEGNLEFERSHQKIIERFGRYPHRNNILGRESSKEELEFLETPGSSF